MRRDHDVGAAPRGFVDSRKEPQQSRFTRAVVADEPNAVALLEGQRDVTQGLDDHDIGLVAPDGAARLAQERLLERA